MTLTITVPERLVAQLQRRAAEEQRSAEEAAVALLEEALDADVWPTPEEVVAKLKALGPDPTAVRPAQGSLVEALRNLPSDPDFDVEEWDRQWEAFEAELKAITRTNTIAEGRA